MNRPHVTFLDHTRGLAILLVVVFHALVPAFNMNQLPWAGWLRDLDVPAAFLVVLPATYGWAGVAIFFVVSGFCIHLSFLRAPVWRDFFVRRFFRIYPPYVVALLLFATIFPGRRLPFSEGQGFAQFFSHLFLVHNFFPKALYGIVGSFWSIAVEVQLYLLYPLLLRSTIRWGWRHTFMLLAAVEVLLRTAAIFLPNDGLEMPKWMLGLPITYWFSWALGAAVAEAYFREKPLPLGTWSIPLLLGVALGSAFFQPLISFSFLFFSVLTAAILSKLLAGARLPFQVPVFLSEHLRRAGVWSYSIYLLHQPIVEAMPWVLARLFPTIKFPPLAMFVLCASSWFFILPLAGVWFRLFEAPSIALSRRLLVKPTAG